MEESIDVVYNTDKAFFKPSIVSMTSLVSNLSSDCKVCFHLFMAEVDEEETIIINSFKEKYGCDIKIYNIDINDPFLKKIKENKQFPPVVLFRLFMFKLLPDNIHYCIYVDGDTIVNCDVSQILKKMNDSYLFAAVVDYNGMSESKKFFKYTNKINGFSKFKNDPNNYPYYNSGFFILNCVYSRKLNIWADFDKEIEKQNNYKYPDQDILNIVIGQNHRDKILILPPEYNLICNYFKYGAEVANSYYSKKELDNAFNNPKILHYIGSRKPWTYYSDMYYEKWWEWALESICSNDFTNKAAIDIKEYKKMLYHPIIFFKRIFEMFIKQINK